MPKLYTDIPYEQRFAEAVEYIVGAKPPEASVKDWLDPNGGSDFKICLQNWVGHQKGVPGWVQNIAVLDAARVMADQPCEGEM